MLQSHLDTIWEMVCAECQKEMTMTAFNCFFINLKPYDFNGREFLISANDKHTCLVIEENYMDLLARALYNVLGADIKPRMVVEEEEEKIKNAELFSEGLSFEDFFTFENFIVGSANKFAHAAAYAVANNNNVIYNPLVIYGPSGVGKTHLMLAIKNHIKKKFPLKKIEYVRGEEFTSELIESLQEGKLGLGSINDFRHKFRHTDVLLIDDIHFIAGKEQTQEEFFNTFNTLYQNNGQIIVTLDRAPKEVKTLDSRIRSRLEAGLLADISVPDFETRVGIIKNKMKQSNITMEEKLVYFIAENIKTNTRQLEGVVKKLDAFINIHHGIPTVSSIQNLIKDVVHDTKPSPIKIEKIISEVAKVYNISEEDILSNRRTANLALARQVAMYIARKMTDLSFKDIGESFGKDHSTVLHNVNQIEKFLADKPHQKELVDDMIKNIKSKNEMGL